MKPPLRMFIAVEIDETLRAAAAKVGEELRGAGAEVTWVATHNMHLTLKFLGDVPEERIPRIGDAVAQAVGGTAAFDLEIRGVGAFPHAARPRTIWIGVGKGTTQLTLLAERVENAVAELGFPRENRSFQGHLTLGRVRRPTRALADLAVLLKQRADLSLGESRIREVVLFSSQLQRGGPVYEAIRRTCLANT